MKKLAVVLAALMMLSTTTFLAAGSPVNTDVEVETAGVQVFTGMMIDKEVAQTLVAEVVSKDAEEITPVAAFVLEGNVPADGKVTVAVEGVTDGENIVALHWYDVDNDYTTTDDQSWVERPAKVVNGKVVIDFTGAAHFSPIIIAKVPSTAPNMYYWLASPFGAATLPKTGAVAVLPVAAMACLAGAVVCGRKEK